MPVDKSSHSIVRNAIALGRFVQIAAVHDERASRRTQKPSSGDALDDACRIRRFAQTCRGTLSKASTISTASHRITVRSTSISAAVM